GGRSWRRRRTTISGSSGSGTSASSWTTAQFRSTKATFSSRSGNSTGRSGKRRRSSSTSSSDRTRPLLVRYRERSPNSRSSTAIPCTGTPSRPSARVSASDAEALAARRHGDDGGTVVQGPELVVRDEAERPRNPFAQRSVARDRQLHPVVRGRKQIENSLLGREPARVEHLGRRGLF